MGYNHDILNTFYIMQTFHILLPFTYICCAILGDLGKELKNLITMMDQEEEEAENTATASSNRKPLPKNMSVSKVITTNSNKESPV